MMRNILFAYITPFHPERGGIGRVTDSLTREFLRRGHKVHYLIYDSAITIHHDAVSDVNSPSKISIPALQ